MIEAPTRVERKLEKSGRITPREVLGAYETTGLKPMFGAFHDSYGRACAVAVVEARYEIPLTWPITSLVRRGYNRDYIWGVVAGFEGAERDPAITLHAEYRGWLDGLRIRKFVLSRYPELRREDLP
jgi:hypothetical protein